MAMAGSNSCNQSRMHGSEYETVILFSMKCGDKFMKY